MFVYVYFKTFLHGSPIIIYISRSESYSVLSPLLSKLRYAYRRNRKNTLYLRVYFKFEIEIAVKS